MHIASKAFIPQQNLLFFLFRTPPPSFYGFFMLATVLRIRDVPDPDPLQRLLYF